MDTYYLPISNTHKHHAVSDPDAATFQIPGRQATQPSEDHGHFHTGEYTPEPVLFNTPISFDDSAVVACAHAGSVGTESMALRIGVEDDNFDAKNFVMFAGTALASPMRYSTFSPSRSTVSCASSSVCSACSTVRTESMSEASRRSLTPRGPSPTHYPQPLRTASGYPVTRRNTDEESYVSKDRHHVCLWGAAHTPCRKPAFATREELNWHVKMEHLLECPVSGCTDTTFDSRELLDGHMKWVHGTGDAAARRTTDLLGAGPASPHDAPGAMSLTEAEKVAPSRRNRPQDAVLKMEMSIGISKKRCRDQLRAVVDRRLRRVNGFPKSGDSADPVRSRNQMVELAGFPAIWEHGVLPFLVEFLPKWCGPGHAVSVLRGKKPNTRRICIMTRHILTRARRMVIAGHVRDLLPESYQNTVTFVFSTGNVNRLVWARGLGKQMPDEVCPPRNPFAYLSPCMGDSIGASLDGGEEVTATLGPCVTAEGDNYWLASFHTFVSAGGRTIVIEHPSPQDRAPCVEQGHNSLDDMRFHLGMLAATSGFDLKTTRITHDPYWEDCDKEPPLVVTDWALISSGARQANMLRKFPQAAQYPEVPVTCTSSVVPGANVMSTGRSSGFQRGQVCEVPTYLDGTLNGTGKATREWCVEEPFSSDSEDEWIRGGVGVEGDSGAAIVDSDTNALVGQLWGRNKYWGPGPRVTYFTPISDLFDDIQERCGMSARPHLPQYRDEADRWPVYPVCKQCYDIQAYRDTRRSSRESLASMIGVHEGRSEHDNDLTSVSELATPKDQSNLFPGSGGVVSPAPIHAFYPPSQAASPGVPELRSPYPQALSDEDLYGSSYPKTSEVAFGKRPAIHAAQEQSTAGHADKRRRITYTSLV